MQSKSRKKCEFFIYIAKILDYIAKCSRILKYSSKNLPRKILEYLLEYFFQGKILTRYLFYSAHHYLDHPQISHSWFLSFWCLIMWLLRLQFVLNLLPHFRQVTGLSSKKCAIAICSKQELFSCNNRKCSYMLTNSSKMKATCPTSLKFSPRL